MKSRMWTRTKVGPVSKPSHPTRVNNHLDESSCDSMQKLLELRLD